jgi:hypothetical protein
MLTLEHTVRSYSGRPGCMCGCNGDYKETDRARKMAITQLLKHPEVQLQSWKLSGGDAGCLFVDTPTRTRALYLTEEGVAAARQLGVTEVK